MSGTSASSPPGRVLMLQGTASHVGKTVLAAALCRIYARRGYRVAPFKAQNMALNSFVTEDGGEMGRAQVYQARAAGLEPQVDMNPVLLKPSTGATSQVVVLGRPVRHMTVLEYQAYQAEVWPVVTSAFARVRSSCDLVVIEGAGSSAEVNLRGHDIVNMRMAVHAGSPVLLVGDIDLGGVFAGLLGHVELFTPQDGAWSPASSSTRCAATPVSWTPASRSCATAPASRPWASSRIWMGGAATRRIPWRSAWGGPGRDRMRRSRSAWRVCRSSATPRTWTIFAGDKLTVRAEGEVLPAPQVPDGVRCPALLGPAGTPVRGYEIHMGRTKLGRGAAPLLRLRGAGGRGHDDGAAAPGVCGTYLHGLFDHPGLRAAFLNGLREARGLAPLPVATSPPDDIDHLADHVEAHLDMPPLDALVGL